MSKCNCVKKRKWLWAGLGVLLLVAAALAAFVFGFREKAAEQIPETATLYWNVERMDYVGKSPDGNSGRFARSDGMYYARLASNGQQADYAFASKDLINKLDQLDVVGLKFDEDGVVVDVLNINQCTGGLVANVLYIQEIKGNTLICNNQGMFKGYTVELQIDENTQIYDVGQDRLLCGLKSQVAVDDEILAIRNYDGSIGYIYRKPYVPAGDVYWNLERKYDSTTKYSTREPDVTGFYVFDMALNGEVVQVRTRDLEIASKIDAKAAKCTGLEFDENGLVSGVLSATTAANGSAVFASWAHVLETNGERVYAVKMSGSNTGEEFESTISEQTKIINVSGVGGELGSYTTLRYGDQIHGILDSRGRIGIVWVVSRLSGEYDYKLYWNVERKYDSTNKVTQRTPSSDGYYYIPVATGGQQITVKTRDKAMATKLDSYAARCFSMKLGPDNEIESFMSAGAIHGGATFGSWYYVDKIDGKNLTVSRILTGDTEPTVLEGVMAEDVEIINGSQLYSKNCGEYTTLKVGDRVHCLKDLNGKIRVAFIVDREIPGPVYWNINKMAVQNNRTTRQRAADGYFYFEMAAGGKLVTLKTKDVELATKIDSVAAKCMGLSVKGDVILKQFAASAVVGCQGSTKSLSWVDVTRINGRTVTALKDPKANHADAGRYFTSTMASNCKIYNVNNNYNTYFGEETTLRVGDRIHVLHNRDGLATVIFVVGRNKALEEKDTCACAQNPQWQPWDGTTPLESNGFYYLTGDVQAPTEGFLIESTVSLRLDGHTIQSNGRCFFLKGNGRLSICDHDTRGKLVGNGIAEESGGVIRVYSADCLVNLWNIDLKAGSTPVAKEGGMISCSGTVSLYNCNLTGGKATSKGGNIQVSSSGTFRMFGGSLNDGSAPSGGNLNGTGRFYLENVTVTGTGVVTCNTDAEMVINGLSAQRLNLVKGTVNMKGSLQLAEITLGGGVIADKGILPESSAVIATKLSGSQVIMTGATEPGYKMLSLAKPKDYALSYDSKAKTVTLTCTVVAKAHENNHCACLGNAQGMGAHTCTELTDWTALTREILVDSPASGNLAFPASGNYYLPLDLELVNCIDILPDQQITLCLNGNTISDTKRMFRVNGVLNITDCGEGGQLVGSAALAPVFYTYAGGELNLFGGTLTSTYTGTASYWGGVGAVASDAGNAPEKGVSTMNMYGGTIVGTKVYKDADGKNGCGGAVYVLANNTFNMYGGSITGGSAEGHGGNLCYGDKAKGQLLGGSITGGQAQKGGDVRLTGTCTITLGGKLEIGSLYLMEGAKLQIQDLDTSSTIGVDMAVPGVIAETNEKVGQCFTSLNGDYSVRQVGNQVKFDVYVAPGSHAHCVCGDTAAGVHTHECETLVYEAWDSKTSLPTKSGNYYLTQDVYLSETAGHAIGANQINLCLNGHKISGAGRLLWLNNSAGTLQICDHAGNSGCLEGPGVADNNAGGLIRHGTSGAHLNLYNITLRRNDTGKRTEVKEGGLISCSAYMDLYNVTLENGYAKNAGNILIALTSKVNIVGCTITGGTACATTGGNIRMSGTQAANPVQVHIVDTVITGGSAKTQGQDVHVNAANVQITLSGAVTVEKELYLSAGHPLNLKDLSHSSSVLLTMAEPGIFANTDKDYASCFRNTHSGLKAFYDSRAGELYLAEQPRPEPVAHKDHCVCAGAEVQIQDHTCETVTWTALTQQMFDTATADSAPVFVTADGYSLVSGGHYYLEETITVNKTLTPGEGNRFSLCLNGCTLQGQGVWTMYFKGTVDLCDCGYTDETVVDENQEETVIRTYMGRVISDAEGYASVVYVRGGAVLNFYGGNLVDSTADTAKDGGIVYVGGEMQLYGGRILGGNSSKNGGNVSVVDGGTVHMHGGQILDGKAAGGGNVNVNKGEFHMHGGLIQNGQSSANGGNVIVSKTGYFYLYDGQILGGQAPTGNGGNLRAEGTFQMTGGTVAQGNAKEGGNISTSSTGTAKISAGTVEDGVGVSGGNLAVFGKLEVSGTAVIRNGIATGDTVYTGGGNIYGLPNATDIQILGGTIENGKALKNGGNIFLRAASGKTGSMTFLGGTVGKVHADCPDTVASVYTYNNKGTLNLYVGGDAVIHSFCMDTDNVLKLHADGITEKASVGLQLTVGTGTVITGLGNSQVDLTKVFTAVAAGLKTQISGQSLILTEE